MTAHNEGKLSQEPSVLLPVESVNRGQEAECVLLFGLVVRIDSLLCDPLVPFLA